MAGGADGAGEAYDDPELITRLRVAVGRIARRLRQSNSGGLTVTQLSALISIEQRGSVRLGDLAALEGIAPSTLSRIVASLEDSGLVARSPDPDDRRSSWVSLTPEAEQVLAGLRGERTVLLARLVGCLDPAERRALFGALPALERLAGELEEVASPADVSDRPASR